MGVSNRAALAFLVLATVKPIRRIDGEIIARCHCYLAIYPKMFERGHY